MKALVVIGFIALIVIVVGEISYSPLRVGKTDEADNDIQINYDVEDNAYFLYFSWHLQYNDDIRFCFRMRPVFNNSDGTCTLTNNTGNFDCLQLKLLANHKGQKDQYNKWIQTPDFTTVINKTTFIPRNITIDYDLSTYYVSLRGTDSTTQKRFSFVGLKNSVFEVVTINGLTSTDLSTFKYNYLTTFYQNFYDVSDNLLMQRQALCFMHGPIVNLVFLGGVLRDSQSIYFAAFINYHIDFNTSFALWEGLSFSKNKGQRDMLGVYPSTGQHSDLFSLIASAPYLDISQNVGGKQDWTMVATSKDIRDDKFYWFYYTQLNRYYQTGDIIGDEIIMQKINNQYCYAAYFSFETNVDSSVNYYYDNEIYEHQLLQCFIPDITLYQYIFSIALFSISLPFLLI